MASAADRSIENGAAFSEAADRSSQAEERYRAGERTLTLLATPLNLMVIRALADGPMRLAELRRATGLPAQTTLRGHLANLGELGVVRKRPTAQMPYAVENELSDMGRELLEVAAHLEAWLGKAPERPVSLEGGAAKGVVKAFVDGWGSTMMRSLAAQPMSLTELDRRIPELSYPALERRLASMRMAGLIEARKSDGAGTPYAVTDWARHGVVPLAAASHCELTHMRQRAVPVTQLDIEAAFMLAAPLAKLPSEASGSCQLEVAADPVVPREQAGVRVTVERGSVVACDPGLIAGSSDFALGSASRWFSAVKGGEVGLLRFGGGRKLAEGIVTGLHASLLG